MKTGQPADAALSTGRMHHFERETRAIIVRVRPSYLDEESSPENNRFVWSYTISIENRGAEIVQLRSRYWRITDATGRVMEVRGAGVVGQQPVLRPGETFEYTSGTPLSTPSGFMAGAYNMQTDGGESFQIEIPLFSLDSPHHPRRIH
jgi:ApaG protein